MVKFSFKEVAPCLFAIFVDTLGLGIVTPLIITVFTSSAHNLFGMSSPFLSYLNLGVAQALFPLLMFFGTAFIGDLSDVIGRKKTLLVSMLGMAVGFVLMAIALILPNLPLFFLGRGLSGLVAASQSVALATISDLSVEDNKAVHLSYVALIQCMGFVLGPLIGGVLGNITLSIPLFGASVLALIAFWWVKRAFEETFSRKKTKQVQLSRVIGVFAEALKNQRVRHLNLVFLLMQVGVGLYLPILSIVLVKEFHYNPLLLGLFNGYLGVGLVVGLLVLLPWLLKRLKIEKVVYVAVLLAVASPLLCSYPLGQSLFWILGFLFALAVEVAFSAMFTAYSNATNKESQGWVMGISMAVVAISWAIASLVTLLVPLIGTHVILFISGLFLLGSAGSMRWYCKQHLQ